MRVRFRTEIPNGEQGRARSRNASHGGAASYGAWDPGTELSGPKGVPDSAAVIETGHPLQVLAERARIVVADDQPDVRMALSLLFKADGHEVETVGSPTALLEAAGRGASLILMDLNYTRDTTSGAEGLDLLRRLRERQPDTPVLVMTAWGSIELAVEAMRRGARGFVLKPWDNGQLQQLVAAELQEAARRLRPPVAGGTHDLSVARRVQAELLPRERPPLATLEYAGLCLQAGAVGGDLYDFLPLGRGRVAFLLADASGKG